jgi:hypothetical protein
MHYLGNLFRLGLNGSEFRYQNKGILRPVVLFIIFLDFLVSTLELVDLKCQDSFLFSFQAGRVCFFLFQCLVAHAKSYYRLDNGTLSNLFNYFTYRLKAQLQMQDYRIQRSPEKQSTQPSWLEQEGLHCVPARSGHFRLFVCR